MKNISRIFQCPNYIKMMFLKYGFSLLVTLLAAGTTKNALSIFGGILELAIIFIITNMILDESRIRIIIGNIVNDILILIFNTQTFVLFFGGTYISMIMLSNLESLEDISSNFAVYGLAIIGCLCFSFIPIKKIRFSKKIMGIVCFSTIICNAIFLIMNGAIYSTIYGLYDLYLQNEEYKMYKSSKIEAHVNDDSEFYRESLENYVDKPSELPDNPNIIVIFTEGLSKSVVEDPRGIMKNVNDFGKESISFNDYYNHTFATFRGLIGQLYSGHQLENDDKNNFTSIQSILQSRGYNTCFINTEPFNEEFTEYLSNFEFQELFTDTSLATSHAKTVSDKDAYDMLYKKCDELSLENEPFFVSIYTFGTHATLDSPDEKFQDGSDRELNKFYNCDQQFSKFLEKFKNSSFYDNTVLVFTTDHCTYGDGEFTQAFPEQNRDYADLDTIPLFIYHKGVKPHSISVDGRNSINMAATLFDYIDLSFPNNFLGHSLFGKLNDRNFYDAIFYDPFRIVTTKNNNISKLSPNDKKKFVEKISIYFSLKENKKVEIPYTPDSEKENVVDEGTYFIDETIDSYHSNVYYSYNYYEDLQYQPEISGDVNIGDGSLPENPDNSDGLDEGASEIPDSNHENDGNNDIAQPSTSEDNIPPAINEVPSENLDSI